MSSTLFWERFAIIVSALALIVSAASTLGTWRQIDIMKAQMTASDKNKAFQSVMEKYIAVCKTIESVPLNEEWRDSEDEGVRLIVREDIQAAYEQRAKLVPAIAQAEEFRDSMKTFGIWIEDQGEMERAWGLADRFARSFQYSVEYSDEEGVKSIASAEAERWGLTHALNLYLCSSNEHLIQWFRTGVMENESASFRLIDRSDLPTQIDGSSSENKTTSVDGPSTPR